MKKLLLLLFPLATFAQSVPNGGIVQGQIWTAAQWNSAWQSKQDTNSVVLTGDVTSVAGSNVTTVDTLLGGLGIAPSAYTDTTNAANIFINGNALSTNGQSLSQYVLEAGTRYPAASAISIASTDGGNLIIQCYGSSWTATLPAIGATSGILPGYFNALIEAPTTLNGSSCVGTGTLSVTTSTMNGSSSTIPIALGTTLLIYTDLTTSPGNYNVINLGAALSTLPTPITISGSGFNLYLQDTGSGTNGGWWNIYSNSASGNLCIAATNDAKSSNHNGICFDRSTDSTASLSLTVLGNSTDAQVAESYGGFKGPGIATSASFGSQSVPSTGGFCTSLNTNTFDCFTGGVQGTSLDANQNYGMWGVPVSMGTPPVLSCSTACAANNAGSAISATLGTSSPMVITVTTNNMAIGEPGTFTWSSAPTTSPQLVASTSVAATSLVNGTVYVISAVGTTNFVPLGAPYNQVGVVFTCNSSCPGTGSGTAQTNPYYVNSTGMAATTFQVCPAAPTWGTSGSGTAIACTSVNGSSAGSNVQVTGWGNYRITGTASQGYFSFPEYASYSSATSLTLTFPESMTNGYSCNAWDVTGPTALFPTKWTATTVSIFKATAPASLDLVRFANCQGF